jgi:hypothetical protein
MKHTEGELINMWDCGCEIYNKSGRVICRNCAIVEAADGMPTEEAVIRLTYEPSASVELFFAAKDMPIEEAVRYIKHGPEMVKLLSDAVRFNHAPFIKMGVLNDIEDLLAKLEGK